MMLCPYCCGRGYVCKEILEEIDSVEEPYLDKVICEECQGNGVLHCCEGLICNE